MSLAARLPWSIKAPPCCSLCFNHARALRYFHDGTIFSKQSASSKRWLDRQQRDPYTLKAKAEDYRSRAAYKLKEMDQKFRLFRPGMTVVDLGFAPGSWSQVAYERTRPSGRVIGVDMIPAKPPRGVSTIQGNFLSETVQRDLREVLRNPESGRYDRVDNNIFISQEEADEARKRLDAEYEHLRKWNEQVATRDRLEGNGEGPQVDDYTVDIVLSDMCDILPQTTGFWLNSINHPYRRLANATGIIARDHTASIDLVDAALAFAIKNLKPGGSFVCKFYTGEEDGQLKDRLDKVFKLVRRIKPDATRAASREMYFVARRKKRDIDMSDVFKHAAPQVKESAF